ncbi:hypothetical protein SLH49_00920 [Cognatiyoonia sp. IB215446]|uniref:hypothetical protein n=1 Tax=Cognatiyoonia sp. IB215446 TaxID=3097355 RepID=UPI002A0D11E0|nr:hypothetical protein [Cognatiyoonia sp. IB215446]MDX8346531.1 hypothetical protein [Cognatiyoonia sp. IB215446]
MTALTEKLAALAAEDEVFVAGARVIAQDGGTVGLAAILREIDVTVLERTLVFGVGDVTASLIVAGRRLRGIAAVWDRDDPAIGQPLSREEPDTLQAAGALMKALCDQASRVTVRAEPIQPFGKGGDAGISATGLAELWQVDLDAKPLPPVARFLAANASSFGGHLLIIAGNTTETAGETTALKLIWDEQVMALRKAQKTIAKRQSGAQMMCFDGAMGAGTAVAIAMAGDEACICAFASEQITALTASWQSIIS